VLTFLAGMEVDPAYMRRRLEASVGIGVSSFAGPFVVTSLVAFFLLDWTLKASLIAGTALSTTSLAVVYAVLVERGLTDVGIGKLLMSATFVTDLCTALALSAIFVKPNIWFPIFLTVSLALILALPRIASWFFGRYGDRVIEPEIKLVFACLLLLMVLADASNGHAVLPAFVLGLVMSRHYQEHREEQKRLRVVAFAFLTRSSSSRAASTFLSVPSSPTSACSACWWRRRCCRRSPSSSRSRRGRRRGTRPSPPCL
jgi:Kef-type K+ transport system membrane component KefB